MHPILIEFVFSFLDSTGDTLISGLYGKWRMAQARKRSNDELNVGIWQRQSEHEDLVISDIVIDIYLLNESKTKSITISYVFSSILFVVCFRCYFNF